MLIAKTFPGISNSYTENLLMRAVDVTLKDSKLTIQKEGLT